MYLEAYYLGSNEATAKWHSELMALTRAVGAIALKIKGSLDTKDPS